jgi:hypothetical protein
MLAVYLGLAEQGSRTLAEAFRQVADGHGEEPDVRHTCLLIASQCDRHAEAVRPLAETYGEETDAEPERLHAAGLKGTREGPLGLLRDLHDLYLLCSYVDLAWTLIGQAAQGARDDEMLGVVQACEGETATQLAWITTRAKQAAPQVLLVG